jgi:hypothetical protein
MLIRVWLAAEAMSDRISANICSSKRDPGAPLCLLFARLLRLAPIV